MNWLSLRGSQLQRCPDCDALIDSGSINIKEGVALCSDCGKLSRLSELNYSDRSAQEILSNPPPGCSVVPLERGVVAIASLRSLGGFLFPAAFALFWNGIVSVFVLLAIAGLYANLVGPLPAWFPAPGLQGGKPQMNGVPMELGATLFLCVFLIPFVTVGVAMPAVALMNLIGKVEVVVDESDSYVATGVGFIKWKTRFDPRQVRTVDYGTTAWQTQGSGNKTIRLSADRTLNFGSLLREDRMDWLRAVLKEMLLNADGASTNSTLPPLTWLLRQP